MPLLQKKSEVRVRSAIEWIMCMISEMVLLQAGIIKRYFSFFSRNGTFIPPYALTV